MENILDTPQSINDNNHRLNASCFVFSRFLERASYYGLRTLLLIFMIKGSLEMERPDALFIYSLFIGLAFIFQILGSIAGDLLIGNRNAIIIGGFIQSAGAFTLSIETTYSLYVGLALILIGGGLYTPNLTSNFGKLYLNKIKSLDAGFTLLYLAICAGAFLGILCLSLLGENYGYNIGFILVGITMIISTIPILLTKEREVKLSVKTTKSISSRTGIIIFVMILVGLYWSIYELSFFQVSKLKVDIAEGSALNSLEYIWPSLDQFLLLPLGLLLIFLWTFFYSSQFFKLLLGFIAGAISFGILFIIPENISDIHAILFIISLTFLALSELFIAPAMHSALTQFSNPKYLAIIISLATIPTKLFPYLLGLFNETLIEHGKLAILIGLASLSVISVFLIAYIWKSRTNKFNDQH